MNIRNLLTKIGGRKLFAWLLIFTSSVVLVCLKKIDIATYKELIIWVTGFLFAGNVVAKKLSNTDQE